MKTMNINEVVKIKGANIIDVRETYEYAEGSIPGAKNIPMTGLALNAESFLNKDETYYIMCQGGGRSMQVCMMLDNQGYDVVQLEGGYASYKQ